MSAIMIAMFIINITMMKRFPCVTFNRIYLLCAFSHLSHFVTGIDRINKCLEYYNDARVSVWGNEMNELGFSFCSIVCAKRGEKDKWIQANEDE